MKFTVVTVSAGCIGFLLQGCGDSGSSSTSQTTSQTTTTGDGSTTMNPHQPAPRDGSFLAGLMNDEFNGYQFRNRSSPFGNIIRQSADTASSNVGLFCGGGCHNGNPDCKLSASIYNSKQMINTWDIANRCNAWSFGAPGGWWTSNFAPDGTGGNGLVGYYFNSTLVKRTGKCLFAWDGSTDGRTNNGCGPIHENCPSNNTLRCTDKHCAYANLQPPNYTSIVNPQSEYVQNDLCVNKGSLPKDGHGAFCYWKGPAFDTVNDVESEDGTHAMLDQRVAHQDGWNDYGPAKTMWNEIVLDANRTYEELAKDAAGTVLAMVYSLSCYGDDSQRSIAQTMSQQFQKKFKLDAPLPVIFLDTSFDASDGKGSPWVFNPDDQPKPDFETV